MKESAALEAAVACHARKSEAEEEGGGGFGDCREASHAHEVGLHGPGDLYCHDAIATSNPEETEIQGHYVQVNLIISLNS